MTSNNQSPRDATSNTLHQRQIDSLASFLLDSQAAKQLIWLIWNLGQLFGTPATNIVKFLVFVYSLGEGEASGGSTKAEKFEILRKGFVQALTALFADPPGFPASLPHYCTYEMAGRIIMSHAGKGGLFPFRELDWKRELSKMDHAGDNVLDGMEIDVVKPILALPRQDKEMALEILAERYPHRNKDTWRSLAAAWQETASHRYKGVSTATFDEGNVVERNLTHFKKRFPAAYNRKRVHTSVHDRILAAAYKARFYCRSKDGKVARIMHRKFPHRSVSQWQSLLNSTFEPWLQLYDFAKIYDDRTWTWFYKCAQEDSVEASKRRSELRKSKKSSS